MASSPTYNSNAVAERLQHGQEPIKSRACSDAVAAAQQRDAGLYPPGSTFKIVTAAAALDSGAFTPSRTFVDPGYCIEYGQRVSNAGNPEIGPEIFGTRHFRPGAEHSINSVFCNIGKEIGAGKILDYAKRFGFYDDARRSSSGRRAERRAVSTSGTSSSTRSDPATQIDPGRLAFGQERLLVTPLQMAMVAGTIANSGELMRPHLVDQVRRARGRS